MWIKASLFAELLTKEATAKGELAALQTRFAAQDAMVDWFRIRLTQLEKERAQMIKQYTNVDIEVPVFAKEPEKESSLVLNEATAFDDVGDEVAQRLGIAWAPDGTLQYSKKA